MLKELYLPVEHPQLKVNGHTFDLQMSDLEIYQFANDTLIKYGDYAKSEHDTAETLAALHELVGSIDRILGDGATKIISGGRPVRMHLAVLWLAKIAEAAADSVAESVDND